MADNEISEEDKRRRFARWEQEGVDAIKADLQAGGHRLVGGPPTAQKLAWECVVRKVAYQQLQDWHNKLTEH